MCARPGLFSPCAPDCGALLPLRVGADSIRPTGMFPHRFVRFRRRRATGASPCPTYANDRTARRAATLQRAFCLWGRRTHGCSLRAADSRPYEKTGPRPAKVFPLLCVGAHSVRPTGPVLPLCVGADSIRPTGMFPIVSGDFAAGKVSGLPPACPSGPSDNPG